MHKTLRIEGYRAGVGMMMLNKKGEVFVAKRVDCPNAWQMPQGGIDVGEIPDEAVLRELKEEIGTDNVKVLKKAENCVKYDFPDYVAQKCWNGKYKGQVQKWFLLEFLGEDDEIDLCTHEQEFTEWKWVDKSHLLEAIVDFKRELYVKVLKELE